jgi:superfamily II DNA or RNA helicase
MQFDGDIMPVEKVRPGDLLMGPDSTPRRVLSIARGRGPLFKIIPVKGEPWVCNDVHVLTLVGTGRDKSVVDVPLDAYLKANKTFRHEHKLFSPPNGIDFAHGDYRDPGIDPYWLGLWVGDGTKALNGVSVSKPDEAVLAACTQVAGQHGLSVRTDGPDYGRCPTHHIQGGQSGGRENLLLSKLRDLFGRPATVFPRKIRVASRAYRLEFLAGIIDSDGYVANGCVEIAQKNRSFAEGIAFVARSLGLRVSLTEKWVGGQVYQRMMLSGDFKWVSTRIPRKALGERRQKKIATRTGFSVEPIGVGDYAGFELDGDGRFLLGDFTVTHNTVIAAHVVAGAYAKGNRVTFCVPSLSLIEQTFERFRENGIEANDMGIIQADHAWRRPDAPIQIATAQTLARRQRPITDVVVCDEAHVRMRVYEEWMKDEPDKLFIGLSATPWSRGLGKLYDDLIQPITMRGLIERGYLTPTKVFCPTHPDLSKVKIGLDGDYEEAGLDEVMGAKTIVADVVATWLAKAERKPTICFAVSRAHAQKLADEFQAAHVPVAYIDAFTPREERDEIGRKLKTGEVEVVCNIGTLIVGVDWDVRCISFARPTRSEILHVQATGRALRPIYPEGFDVIAATDAERAAAVRDGVKANCLILDHAGNHLRMGMVDEIVHDELPKGKPPKPASERDDRDKIPLPTECKACGCLIPARLRACPNCGAPKRGLVDVEQLEGELAEFRGKGKRRRDKSSVIEQLQAKGKPQVWGEIRAMQIEFGWSDGRSAHVFRDIFDVWPNAVRDARPTTPSTMLRSWVRSRSIAYAKSRCNQDAAQEVA